MRSAEGCDALYGVPPPNPQDFKRRVVYAFFLLLTKAITTITTITRFDINYMLAIEDSL